MDVVTFVWRYVAWNGEDAQRDCVDWERGLGSGVPNVADDVSELGDDVVDDVSDVVWTNLEAENGSYVVTHTAFITSGNLK